LVGGGAGSLEQDQRKKNSRSLNLKHLYDPGIVWNHLNNNQPISQIEDESYLNIAIDKWLLNPDSSSRNQLVLGRLALSLQSNHNDMWLSEFLHSGVSKRGNALLIDAVRANYSGDADRALQSSVHAKQVYLDQGNTAGALLSQFQQLYSLRRHSMSEECLKKAENLIQASSRRHYRWIEIQATIEKGSCAGMRNQSDVAWAMAATAAKKATDAKYQVLYLRALGLRGNLDMIEGRSDAAWIENENALRQFWGSTFPDDRAFQLYYNLQSNAEKNGALYLALILQRETLNMIAGRSRFDFEAMAHFRMAGAAQSVGDIGTARTEMKLYKNQITQISASSARDLYEAYCEVGLARLAVSSEHIDEARQHLTLAAPVASQNQNSMLRLEFLQASVDLDFLTHNTQGEKRHLEEIALIANAGFRSLKSAADRWRWRRVVERTYRRLLEIELASTHSTAHALGYWELYRQLESAPSLTDIHFEAENIENRALAQVAQMHDSTLISFAVLHDNLAAWVADDRGIKEFKLNGSLQDLKGEVRRFYSLCSDPNSSIEKVNASGLRLYRLLIAPMEETLAPGRTLHIEGDGFLSMVPWAALRNHGQSYFGTVWAFTISPGLFARPGVEVAPRTTVRKVTIVIPDSVKVGGHTLLHLVNADDEAIQLKLLYPHTEVLRGNEVTVANVIDQLRESDIFEFAGHAVTREHGGELIMPGGDAADILSSATLQSLHLERTKLVVLSACSTAAEQDADRDPNGLVKAFLNTGVSNLIATRWDVDSRATAVTMNHFYSSLQAGEAEPMSLRKARSESTKNGLAHPFYWAAFELFSSN
jgi:CHAT domain-containing protein